jgi:hypothetical protein
MAAMKHVTGIALVALLLAGCGDGDGGGEDGTDEGTPDVVADADGGEEPGLPDFPVEDAGPDTGDGEDPDGDLSPEPDGIDATDGEEEPDGIASPGWPIEPDPGARLIFSEDYESGTCDRIGDTSSAAVVSEADGADVFDGTYSLRGNFDPDTVDPITGRQGETRYGGLDDISLSGAGDRMYVSMWWRLDPDVAFVAEESSFGGYKLAYITGSAEPWADKVNYVVGQGWGATHWWLVNNSPNASSISFSAEAYVSDAHAALGQWHRIEWYLRLETTPGDGDGVGIVKIDGTLYIEAYDVTYLWPGAPAQTWGGMGLPSMFGGPSDPTASFGWQMDDLEIWDGLPP